MTGCARKPACPSTSPIIPWSRLCWELACASRTSRLSARSCCPNPGANHTAAAPAAGWGVLVHDTRRTRMVLGVLLALALALIATDYLGGSAPLRAIGGAVFGPAERAVRSVGEPIA